MLPDDSVFFMPKLVLALLARLIPVICGLPGMIVAVTGPKLPKTDAMEAELGMAAENETGVSNNCQNKNNPDVHQD